MPTVDGTWETAGQRYQIWCASGLWPRIVAELAQMGGYVSLWG